MTLTFPPTLTTIWVVTLLCSLHFLLMLQDEWVECMNTKLQVFWIIQASLQKAVSYIPKSIENHVSFFSFVFFFFCFFLYLKFETCALWSICHNWKTILLATYTWLANYLSKWTNWQYRIQQKQQQRQEKLKQQQKQEHNIACLHIQTYIKDIC